MISPDLVFELNMPFDEKVTAAEARLVRMLGLNEKAAMEEFKRIALEANGENAVFGEPFDI